MAVVSVTNTFTSLTPAVASEVNRNFTDVVEFVNSDTVHRDGSRPFTGEVSMGSHRITNVVGGVSANDAVNVAQLGGALPAGFIGMYGSDAAPSAAWLLCDGAAYSRASYPDLFAAIGTSYGVGDGATTFNVPNLNNAFPFGASAGETGGSNDAATVSHTHTTGTHKHSVDNHKHTMGTHSHTLNKHKHSIDHNHPAANTKTDGAHAHDTIESNYGADSQVAGYVASPGWIALNGLTIRGGQTYERGVTSKGSSHKHSFDMPLFEGTSGEPSTANTSSEDPGDTGDKTGLSTSSVGAGTTGSTGSSGSGANRPAFVGVNFIIKSGL